MMIVVENSHACFVQLWLQLERTRRLLGGQYRRFCIRRVLKSWMGPGATDDFVWEVCRIVNMSLDEPVYGCDELPLPSLYPRVHREFLRAFVAVSLGIGMRKVKLRDLDAAYSVAFPHSTPINISKKKRQW